MDILTIILIIELFIGAFMVWIVWSCVIGAPWVPTPKSKVRSMLELAEVGQRDLVYDLGSGDGRIIAMASKEFGARVIGIEADPFRVLWSRISIKHHNLEQKAKVIRGNFFNINIGDATVVTLYQGHEINKKIRRKLFNELKPGTRIVSYRFNLNGWTPAKVEEDLSIYLYVV